MKPSTKDEINGNVHQVKGVVKETAGKVTNNPLLEAKGKAERYLGRTEKKVGQIKKALEK
ncbi:MAG TPA: CsbD family protein [Terracidiphilus sp.]|nr:CsbD family protein [Terracidiphilus sp.]